MRCMSFALTEPQLMDGSKTVTRRTGWQDLKPGTRLPAAGIADRGRVFLVPEGVDAAALDAGLRALSPVCIKYGFRLGHRLHLSLYGNTPGT